MRQQIQYFFQQYVPFVDCVLLLTLLISVIIGLLYLFANLLTYHYTGENYLPALPFITTAALLVLLIAAWYMMDTIPRLAYLTRTFCLGKLMFISFAVIGNGIQRTPFPTIDKYLAAIDQHMGINTNAILSWMHQHAIIKAILNIAYGSIFFQLLLIPLIIAFLLEKKSVDRFLFSAVFSFLIGATIYYFFPTSAPVSIFHSAYFFPIQHDTYLKFYEVHHYLPVTTGKGGLISFPSFHVIWITLLTMMTHPRKWFFYPLLIFNCITIASTVLLGWHYSMDVVAGFILTWLVTVIAEKTLEKI